MLKLKSQKFKWGLILIAIGAIIWTHNYGLLSVSFNFSRDWPAILIAFGMLGVWRSISLKYHSEKIPLEEKKKIVGDILRDVERGNKSAEDAISELHDRKAGRGKQTLKKN